MKVINIFSGPSGGKSTTSAGLFFQMKIRGYEVELVTEYAKELVYDEAHVVLVDRQEVIFAEQNQRLDRLRGKVDYVINDSPLLLSNIYPIINCNPESQKWQDMQHFGNFVRQVFDTYDNINIFMQRGKKFQDYGRYHDHEQSKLIDQMIKNELADREYHIVNTRPEAIDEIIEIIETHYINP